MKNKTTLPKWFDGTVYETGDTVTNPFSGESYELNNLELSMYDFVMGCAMMPSNIISDKIIKNWQDGLSWFRTHNSKAYMVLLD
jgi:hypothetical protein|tara:strand:+ start:423 stop:674 length:252 start_codon:yes stop_codon:yes gene_type:complete